MFKMQLTACVFAPSVRSCEPEEGNSLDGFWHRIEVSTIFNSADVAVIAKMDLAAAVEFDESAAMANIQAVRPGMQVFKVSAQKAQAMEDFLHFLAQRRSQRMAAAL